jgi:hypothetical protein
MKTYTMQDVRRMVERQAKKAGSLRAYARQTGCTVAYLSDVLRARRDPGPKVLTPLGLEKIEPRYEIRYRRTAKENGHV